MLVFIGDVHAEFDFLSHVLRNVPDEATLIQVGDMGVWPKFPYEDMWNIVWNDHNLKRFKNIYFIDGNHEHHPTLENITEPTEIWTGLTYIPRGTILNLDGHRIGFLGGAASVDAQYREYGVDVFEREIISEKDAAPLFDADPVDILVTHTAPQSMIDVWIGAPIKWNLPVTWKDPSSAIIERVWDHHNRPPLICGHFHTSLMDGNFRILDILEVHEFRSWEMEDGNRTKGISGH